MREPQDVHAVLGRDVVLNCEVEGYPRPTTLWTRANGELFSTVGLWLANFMKVCLKVQNMT